MVQIISAGAGSGKTYRLNKELVMRISSGETRISGLFATTFTVKAATELKERVRMNLLENGMLNEAQELSNALIGTVHELGVKLIKRFAYSGGLSPQVNVISDDDRKRVFNQSLAHILSENNTVEVMNELCIRLGLSTDIKNYDWLNDISTVADVTRGNFFSKEIVEQSKQKSIDSFLALLPSVEQIYSNAQSNYDNLVENINEALSYLTNGEDATKKTETVVGFLKSTLINIKTDNFLPWAAWAKLSNLDVSKKSEKNVSALQEFAALHTKFPDFQNDISQYISLIFDLSARAMVEYQNFKKKRGLIDYTDMEVEILRLISMPHIAEILRNEIDLLLVDEFQDINPLQLDIFLKLSQLASHSIWVGDPKQSIYGFRYAEPRLMRAVIDHFGISEENILDTSYRSRRDIVHLSNALFLKSFEGQIPLNQIALKVNRVETLHATSSQQSTSLQHETLHATSSQQSTSSQHETLHATSLQQSLAIKHWHFKFDNDGNNRSKGDTQWLLNCTAENIASLLKSDIQILPKGEKILRNIKPSDVAVLCMTNRECANMAAALNRLGISAAFPRVGLMETTEIKLISAILHFLLDKRDSLSVAEILYLTENYALQDISINRWEFIKDEDKEKYATWHADNDFIKKIDALRNDVLDLSASEILDTAITQLDLRRKIAAWGSAAQRLQNVEMLRKMGTDYEQHCKKMHEAASLNHFLMWLQKQARNSADKQSTGAGENAVNILTYHASKGLEFPITILSSLDKDVRENVWGLNIESNSNDVDFENILGNRWMRFWVNPYSNSRAQETPISEKLNICKEKLAAELRALEEEARLLYVGITRARDYLIFVSATKGMSWLNRVWNSGDSLAITLDSDCVETLFEYDGAIIKKENVVQTFSKDFGSVEIKKNDALYTEPLFGEQNFAPRAINATEKLTLFTKLSPENAVKQTLYSILNSPATDSALQAAFSNSLVSQYFLKTSWQPNATFIKYLEANNETDIDAFSNSINQSVDALKKSLSEKFNNESNLEYLAQLPICLNVGARVFNTEIPIVVKSESTLMIIFYTSSIVDNAAVVPNLTELFLSSKAIEKTYSFKPHTFLFDVKTGSLTEINFS